MNRDEIINVVLEIIAKIAPDEDLTDLDPEVPLREQLELDSVDFLDMVMELRKNYGVDVPEEDYMELMTLERCVAYLGPRLKKAGTQ